jgi:hypothetical protein
VVLPREPFRHSLEELLEDFRLYLSERYSDRTVNKHGWIIEMFIEFLSRQTDVERLEEVTRGIVNTHFRQWYTAACVRVDHSVKLPA